MADVPLPTDPLDDDVNVTGVEPVVDVDLAATSGALGGVTAGQTSTAGQDITLDLGDDTTTLSVAVDTNGSAVLTVEVRRTGGVWRTYDSVNYSNAVSTGESYDIGFAEARVSVDSNLNALEASAKGV